MEKKHYEIIAIGNSLIDIQFLTKRTQIEKMGLLPGSMTLIDKKKKEKILQSLIESEAQNGDGVKNRQNFGGSAGNTIYHMAKMGLKCALVGSIAMDEEGQSYLNHLSEFGIDFYGPKHSPEKTDKATGTCIVLIDEYGERTMLTYLGCAKDYSKKLPDLSVSGTFLFVEGYAIDEGIGKAAIEMWAEKLPQSKLVLSAGDASCIKNFPDVFQHLFDKADLLFANDPESIEIINLYGGKKDDNGKTIFDESIFHHKKRLSILTGGENGALVIGEKILAIIPAIPTHVVDLVGAGDSFAAGFLAKLLLEKWDLKKGEQANQSEIIKSAGEHASKLASEVIARYGPR